MDTTPAQQKAIETQANRVLVVAGPGSGKTTTLISRIQHLIVGGQHPMWICVITFTNAAARELRERLATLGITGIGYVGTLHGFCFRLLQHYGAAVDFPTGSLQVLDEDQAAEMLAKSIAHLSVKASEKKIEEALREWMPGREARTPLQQALAHYNRALKHEGLVDFDTLTREALRLLRMPRREIEAKVGAPFITFDHLFVDEIQDSSELDFLIYEQIPATSRFLVGDPDQAIYGFRGGDVRGIIDISRSPNWETIYLEENFRCSRQICAHANNLITHNTRRAEKRTLGVHDRGRVFRLNFDAEGEEIAAVLRDVRAHLFAGATPEQIAILGRSNGLVTAFVETAKAVGLPVRARKKTEGLQEWQRARLAVEVLANPRSKRAGYNWIKAKFGQVAADTARTAIVRHMQTDYLAELNVPLDTTPATLPDALGRFGIGMHEISRVVSIRDALTAPDLAQISLAMAANREQPEEGEGITITTMHAAKGREWAIVYLVGVEQESIPGTAKTRDLEEERRILFVGLTRAKEWLSVSNSASRRQNFGRKELAAVAPSQFLAEAGL